MRICAYGLYLIEILHQTTTVLPASSLLLSCILSKFYIKPQQQPQSFKVIYSCILSKFYIKPQLYPVDECPAIRCILSKFYIKPQHVVWNLRSSSRCILSKFYIKPQRRNLTKDCTRCCILSKFYIKPQHSSMLDLTDKVVSYRNSTSNHNFTGVSQVTSKLYLIEILHQTTTSFFVHCFLCRCILSKFYIKPQPKSAAEIEETCCILSKFYIKPQHKTKKAVTVDGCILSKFYIKPQRRASY